MDVFPAMAPLGRDIDVERVPVMQVPAAVLFDFNGTLADDERITGRIYRDVLAAHGIRLTVDQYMRKLVGRTDAEITSGAFQLAGRAIDGEATTAIIAEKTRRYCEAVESASPIRPDAVELLSILAERSVPLGIVSSAFRVEIAAALAASGLSTTFAAIVSIEDVHRPKPDPEGYVLALSLLGQPAPARTVAFEDSIGGLRAAKAAGLLCYAITGSVPRAELAKLADWVDDRFDDGRLNLLARE